jgi:aminoglycoside phosphotransferase (APT) family kinase protein
MTSLALLHPTGILRSAIVRGEETPNALSTGLPEDHGGPADLIVVGPNAEERETARILEERLAPDGLAYVVSGQRARRRLARRAGLEVAVELVLIGDRAAPRFLVPAQPQTVRWAVRTLTSSRRALVAGRLPFIGSLAPAAIVRKPGARRLAEWLEVDDCDVVLGHSTALVVRDGSLTRVAKTGARAAAEKAALEQLGPAARAAGVAVPHILGETRLGDHVIIESGLQGRPAATVLARRPRDLDQLLGRIADWLVRWNSATAVEASITRELLERMVLEPARDLALEADYASWLQRRSKEIEGMSVKLVDTHNDLTTANILVNGPAPLGVVDWESAASGGLPLTDLFYAAADAHAAADGFGNRVAAFRQSVQVVATAERRIDTALALEPRIADLCFHACWLGHAHNEASRGDTNHEFGDIVRTIAREGIRMDG